MSYRKEIKEVTIKVCDWCGEDITDYSSTSVACDNSDEKHYHSEKHKEHIYDNKLTCIQQKDKKDLEDYEALLNNNRDE